MANRLICTHLSNHIFSSQFSFGNELPGIVNKKVEMSSQATGNTKEGLIFFKKEVSAILTKILT